MSILEAASIDDALTTIVIAQIYMMLTFAHTCTAHNRIKYNQRLVANFTLCTYSHRHTRKNSWLFVQFDFRPSHNSRICALDSRGKIRGKPLNLHIRWSSIGGNRWLLGRIQCLSFCLEQIKHTKPAQSSLWCRALFVQSPNEHIENSFCFACKMHLQ